MCTIKLICHKYPRVSVLKMKELRHKDIELVCWSPHRVEQQCLHLKLTHASLIPAVPHTWSPVVACCKCWPCLLLPYFIRWWPPFIQAFCMLTCLSISSAINYRQPPLLTIPLKNWNEYFKIRSIAVNDNILHWDGVWIAGCFSHL